MKADPELDRILADEIESRLPLFTLESEEPGELRAALHSLRGATAMAGHIELSVVLSQLSARLRAGEPGARSLVGEVLGHAAARLRSGQPPLDTRWPVPPAALCAMPIDERYRGDYEATLRDKLGELDVALASHDDPGGAIDTAYRAVHGMKSSAAAASDDVTTWFCHGLEEELKAAPRSGRGALDYLVQLTRHRTIFALLLDDPARALEALRTFSPSSRVPAARSAPPTKRPTAPPPGAGELRVPVQAVERAMERLTQMESAYDELRALLDLAHRGASQLRLARARLMDLPRLAATEGSAEGATTLAEELARTLGAIALTSERGGYALRRATAQLRSSSRELSDELKELRTTRASILFERATRGLYDQAAMEGKQLQIDVRGGDTPLDRSLADAVLEAITQLTRNAVAHGIETPEVRTASGKPTAGHMELRAQRVAGRLRIEVADDGRGVDMSALKRTAGSLGIDSVEGAHIGQEDELLTLLVLPGLTTRAEAGLLAGRGVGLNLANETVTRLGGSLTLRSRPEQGFVATLDLPVAGVSTDLIWLRAAHASFALPAAFTRAVTTELPDIHLNALLPGEEGTPSRRLPGALGCIALAATGMEPIRLGVDAVGVLESRVVHPVPALVKRAGPYLGAVRRGDGSLRLVLDAHALATRAHDLLGRLG